MRQILLLLAIALTFMSIKAGVNIYQSKMKIKAGNRTFTATLHDNQTAKAFHALLPITLDMVELNGNEKYGELPKRLPTDKFNPDKIETGDILLYGSSTLVIFYKSFTTSYSYTRIGKIDDASGLAEALGKGNIQVSFETRYVF